MQALRASILHCLADPGEKSDPSAWEYFEDGLLAVDDGRVIEVGPAEGLLRKLPADLTITDYRGKLIVPGFIDCHVHFPQLDIIGSYGAQLLDWLNQYAYPAEARFADHDYAREVANAFIEELLRNGTTTALVFGTAGLGLCGKQNPDRTLARKRQAWLCNYAAIRVDVVAGTTGGCRQACGRVSRYMDSYPPCREHG